MVELDKLDATETTNAQRWKNTQVGQLDAAELFVDSIGFLKQ